MVKETQADTSELVNVKTDILVFYRQKYGSKTMYGSVFMRSENYIWVVKNGNKKNKHLLFDKNPIWGWFSKELDVSLETLLEQDLDLVSWAELNIPEENKEEWQKK